ncbi:MAG: hypothetical protein AAGA92_08905 [Planctomycetota bacterium]
MTQPADDHRPAQSREVRKLVSAANDVGLSPEQQQRLADLLAGSPELRKEYVRLVVMDAQLETLHSRPLLDDPEGSEGSPPIHEKSGEHVPAPHASARRSQAGAGRALDRSSVDRRPHPALVGSKSRTLWINTRWVIAGATAALLAVAATLSFSGGQATVVAVEMGGEDRCDWEVGDRVGNRWVAIESGVVQLSFGNSTMVALHGPARFRALGNDRAELDRGALTVHVPDSAAGFSIVSGGHIVEDLGTGFSMRAEPNGRLLVHVTEGRVRVAEDDSGETVIAKAGDQVVADPASEGNTIQKIEASQQKPKTRGQFVFEHEHPRSLRYGQFNHDHRAFVFLESKRRTLPTDLTVNISTPGRYTKFSEESGTIPAGTTVDCYLIHCAPLSASHEVRGSVTFPGEVLGIIAGHDRLNATNNLLGANWTLRCDYIHRGLEMVPVDSSDVLMLGDDRRTVSATLRNIAIDQLRVLVRAD